MPDVFVSKQKKEETVEVKTSETPVPQTPIGQKVKDLKAESGHGLFSVFSLYPDPKKVDFETRSDDEEVVLFLRQHPIVNIKWIIVSVVTFLVPSIAKSLGVFNSIPDGFELVITMAWYLFTMAYAFENFLNWYFNVYIVTNERIVDVNFHNLIYKSVSDATLDNIQDVTYNMGGVTRTLFNYGDVFIQTASEVSRFDFVAVPNPSRVSKIINELTEEHEENK